MSDIEEQAARQQIDVPTLSQARADLGIVTSRANTGGAHVGADRGLMLHDHIWRQIAEK